MIGFSGRGHGCARLPLSDLLRADLVCASAMLGAAADDFFSPTHHPPRGRGGQGFRIRDGSLGEVGAQEVVLRRSCSECEAC